MDKNTAVKVNNTFFSYDYQSKQQKIGCIHIGVGAFHRAHQALYFDDLLGKNYNKDWCIAGVNLRSNESDLVKKINNREGKYFLKTMSEQGDIHWHEVNSIQKIIDWTLEPQNAYNLFTLENVKMVTITVTESGYYVDGKNQLNLNHPIIKEELASDVNLGSIFGFLREALNFRMNQINEAITIVCCDNLRQNGDLLKACFYNYLKNSSDQYNNLLLWLDDNVSFPCTMVDRITPKPPQTLSDEVWAVFNVENDSSVMAEDYIQWIIEDKFATFRPSLEKVGVQIVEDITPYEETKIRILNGGHTGLVYLGALEGYTYFDELIGDSNLISFFDEFEDQEVIPALKIDFSNKNYDSKVTINFKEYKQVIKRRFSNKNIKDTIARISSDGASKFAIYILPTTQIILKQGLAAKASAKIIASWYLFLGKLYKGEIPFEYVDSKWHQIAPNLMQQSQINLDKFLNCRDLWSSVIDDFPDFKQTINEQIQLLSKRYK